MAEIGRASLPTQRNEKAPVRIARRGFFAKIFVLGGDFSVLFYPPDGDQEGDIVDSLFLDLAPRFRKASPRSEAIYVDTVLLHFPVQRTAGQAMLAGNCR